MEDEIIESQINEIVSLYFDGYTVSQAIEIARKLQREAFRNEK